MKVFIQKKPDGEWLDTNCFSALTWFTEMGYEIVPFVDIRDVEGLTKETPVVGGIGSVVKALEQLGIPRPKNFDIPKSLEKYAHRRLSTSTLGEIRNDEDLWPVFIKPLSDHKRFTGLVIRHFADLLKLVGLPDELPVLASEPIRFDGEYRCFVLDQELLDIRRYAGTIHYYPDVHLVNKMILDFAEEAPRAYSVDVGQVLDAKGNVINHTTLVEVNDAFSLGTYGLPAFKQVKMITARWKEMTGTK